MKLPILSALALGAAAWIGGASAETVSHFGLYEIHTFTDVGETTFTPEASVTADILVVAGGGAGGGAAGGGGGGGQVRILRGVSLAGGQPYSVIVGAGGVNDADNVWGLGPNGADSSFGEYVAIGGGGGAGCWAPAGSNGGNGGGGANGTDGRSAPGYPITNEVDQAVSGYAGGAAVGNAAAGGGGAGGPGQDGDPLGDHPSDGHYVAGAGGPGLACDFSGEVVYYGAGGGGGSNGTDCHQSGLAGLGGTGHGGEYNMYPQTGFAGTDGTGAGGGGGGAGRSPSAGGAGGSGIVIVRFVPPADGTLPLAGPLVVSSVTATTAELAWRLVSDGGEGPCAVVAAYGYDADNCSRSATLAESATVGETTTTLTGLTPGRTYYLKLTATNAAGTGESRIISFATTPEFVSTEKSPYAGLLQTTNYYHELQYDWNVGAWNYDPDPFMDATSVRMPGVVITNSRLPCADENGNIFYLPDFAIYTYGGYIYLEGGKSYAVGKYFGEHVMMTVDGKEVFSDDDGDHFKIKTFTVDETGWHAVHFLIGKSFYFYGPKGDIGTTDHWNSSLGFAYRADGSTAELPQSAWTPFVDPGDGSFLCTKLGFRTCAVDTWSVAGTTLSAALKYSAGERAFALKAFAGATYGGEDVDGWEDVIDLGTVAADATQGSVELTLPAGAAYVRFALVDAEGDILPGWSATIALSDAVDPSFGEAAATDVGGVSANLSVTLGAKGIGVDSVGVTLLFGAAGEEAEINLGDFTTAPTVCSYVAEGLHPGMTYRYRFLAENDQGGKTSTPWAELTTPAGSELGAEVSASLNQRQVSITGSLKTLGADVTTVKLMMGPDADHLELVESFQPTTAGTFVRIFEGVYDATYVYRFESENACDGQSWTSQSNLGSFTVRDTSLYYWKNGESGAWNESEHWECNATDCVGYPVAGSEAIFKSQDDRYEGPEPLSKIEVTGSYALSKLAVEGRSNLEKQGHTVWLWADPEKPAPLLALEVGMNFERATNSKLIFDHLAFTGPKNTAYAARNFTLVLTNGTDLSLNSLPFVDPGQRVEMAPGTSLNVGTLNIGGEGSALVLDNAKVTATGNGNMLFGGNTGGGSLIIRGADSQIVFEDGFGIEKDTGVPFNLVFDVPPGGYAQVPLYSDRASGMDMFRWWNNGLSKMIISIDPASRVARGPSGDYQLIECSRKEGIRTDLVELGNVPNPETDYFYWLPEDAEKPSQLWVHIKSDSPFQFIVR